MHHLIGSLMSHIIWNKSFWIPNKVEFFLRFLKRQDKILETSSTVRVWEEILHETVLFLENHNVTYYNTLTRIEEHISFLSEEKALQSQKPFIDACYIIHNTSHGLDTNSFK
jgi:hypothetical protein